MSLPPAQGLYDPRYEHDACGLGFVVHLKRPASHDIVKKGLEVLRRLAHRGAAGSDPLSGDGAGILTQVPHAYFERVMAKVGIDLPLAGDYGVGQLFLSRDPTKRGEQMRLIEETIRYHNQKVIGWRQVPVEPSAVGPVAQQSMPLMMQVFIGRMCPGPVFERVLFTIRKRAGRLIASAFGHGDFYVSSLSSRTIVYKGLALPEKLGDFYLDLRADDFKSQLALVHSRFSTNTFPTWERAHPYRKIAHNGEINTLRGNTNWMSAREAMLESEAFREHLGDFKPIIRPGGSDSASLDNVVDFLVAGGRSLPHVMMMLVPEAWASQSDMPAEKRAFYEYHAGLIEPWDGPAGLLFTDGQWLGATLDRNGLRPAKYIVTKSGYVCVASEFGVLDFEPEDVLEKGRLQPGKMFLVDVAKGRIVGDEEVKLQVASRQPYAEWVADNKLDLSHLPEVPALYSMSYEERQKLQRVFGYSREDLGVLLAPMALAGEEPTGSMGTDIPLAVLSDRPQVLFRYFKQQFAQVTNPPIDPIREDLVMSLVSCVGGEGNLLTESPKQARLLELPHPILSNTDIARLKKNSLVDFRAITIPALFDATARASGNALERALEELAQAAERAVNEGHSIIIVSDRGVDATHAPIPSLLAVGCVHHALIRRGKRVRTGLIVETGEAREVADVALLIGFGAGAVNPYLAFESVQGLVASHAIDLDAHHAQKNYVKAVNKGLLKVLSKMGISTLSSYHGAQIFEAVGISKSIIDRYLVGCASPLGGIGLAEIAKESLMRHRMAFAPHATDADLSVGGVYAWRATGERHLWSPRSVAALQKAVRLEDAESYAEYAKMVNDQADAPMTLRGLWDFLPQENSIALDDVEPAAAIVKRFCTGAMSFGSISKEAHETLAVAMNRIGGKSNTGEGGEDETRFVKEPNGDLKRSAIKQVASGRFGVTAHYLVNADELQIKVAQGAKPGEGGQLPGTKVDAVIARVRHSTPGVTLISPPPHHDIYSIEDLAQLIFDLKNVNPEASISVKLVSESGVGTIAAGVAKAHADGITIAGHDGGTGASPLSSIQHAGTPWELGLAETQQVLLLNGLRGRVRVQVDGQLKTGRDVAFAALLGAEEFGFATAPLVATGCIMMRKCHLNTCPVGVATQDPVLRARFKGTPEHVINYLFFVAEELRAIMARLGFRTLNEMVGRVDCIRVREGIAHEKARMLDFSKILHKVDVQGPRYCVTTQEHGLDAITDRQVIDAARVSIKYGEASSQTLRIQNSDRAFGAMLAGVVAKRWGKDGLPEGRITIEAKGTAGQSFGAFAVKGMLIALEGDANDYVGKGLSGGTLAVFPPPDVTFYADDNVIVGNTVMYGATSGRAFFAGRGGERFAVRNSGATAVVEGVGDHGCEYMTGGTVVILGATGRNFGAGMSGGIAYVLDEDGAFASRINPQMITLESLDAADEAIVKALIDEHVRLTRSSKGQRLLARWDASRFVKVIPIEYKRVMSVTRREAANPTA
jgi:glutamate synthase (NADPH/NADH) large chain